VVVGPAASGKSNLVDAIRWVLGEQGSTSLRSRQATDVAFAGDSGRVPMGMTEVSLALEQEDDGLSLACSKVTVTRRSFREDESHSLIGGKRARLCNVLQLVASLGPGYGVVSQGLVDAVLCPWPADRGELVEQATGLVDVRLRHAAATAGLAQADAHALRLEDLFGELHRRLQALERSARHAEAGLRVRVELRHALWQLYARWAQAVQG
jgi:chromosome segregation protein